MTCREVADFMMDYVSGDLPAAVRRRFDWHLLTCGNCRRYLATYRATIAIGQKAFRDLDRDAAAEIPEELIRVILNSKFPPTSSS